MMQKASAAFGIKVDIPQWVEIPKEIKYPQANDYNEAIHNDLDAKFTTLAVVIINKKEIKP